MKIRPIGRESYRRMPDRYPLSSHNHEFVPIQLRDLLGGSDARSYALVHRALKDGSLIRLKRATYMLGRRTSNDAVHPFVVAQVLLPGSYISLSWLDSGGRLHHSKRFARAQDDQP